MILIKRLRVKLKSVLIKKLAIENLIKNVRDVSASMLILEKLRKHIEEAVINKYFKMRGEADAIYSR